MCLAPTSDVRQHKGRQPPDDGVWGEAQAAANPLQRGKGAEDFAAPHAKAQRRCRFHLATINWQLLFFNKKCASSIFLFCSSQPRFSQLSFEPRLDVGSSTVCPTTNYASTFDFWKFSGCPYKYRWCFCQELNPVSLVHSPKTYPCVIFNRNALQITMIEVIFVDHRIPVNLCWSL